jgi:hypothetical protein
MFLSVIHRYKRLGNLNIPTKTAEAPPKPPAMKDLIESVADETRDSSVAVASLL